MSEKSSQASSGGIGFCGLLTVLFVGLKLTGFINWSWWSVTAPMWGPLVLVVVVFLIMAGIAVWLNYKPVDRRVSRR